MIKAPLLPQADSSIKRLFVSNEIKIKKKEEPNYTVIIILRMNPALKNNFYLNRINIRSKWFVRGLILVNYSRQALITQLGNIDYECLTTKKTTFCKKN